jgi:citrate lyase gamma subunit
MEISVSDENIVNQQSPSMSESVQGPAPSSTTTLSSSQHPTHRDEEKDEDMDMITLNSAMSTQAGRELAQVVLEAVRRQQVVNEVE